MSHPIRVTLQELLHQRIVQVILALEKNSTSDIKNTFSYLHASESAMIIHFLNISQRSKLLEILGKEFDFEILTYLDENIRDSLLSQFAEQNLGEALSELDPEDAVEILAELQPAQRYTLLRLVKPEVRVFLEGNLAYPEESAGRLMSYDFVALPKNWTVGHVRLFLSQAQHVPKDLSTLFIVDEDVTPVGKIYLSELLYSCNKQDKLHDVMDDIPQTVRVDTEISDLVFIFKQYSLSNVPVLDHIGKMVGMISVENLIDNIYEEAEESLLHLVGVEESDFHSGLYETSKLRLQWLMFTVVTSCVTSLILQNFEVIIAKKALLAALMPIVPAISGNAGIQVVTVTVCALSRNEIGPLNRLRVIQKECLVGLLNGYIIGSFVAAVVFFWTYEVKICLVLFISLLLNMLWACIAGVAVPLILEYFEIDPATSAGPFLTMSTDVMGYIIFFVSAIYLLNL